MILNFIYFKILGGKLSRGVSIQKQRTKVINMNSRELMLRQIDATLEQEKNYVEEFDKQLKDPNVLQADRERIIMFRQASLIAIDRCKKARLKYR